jgi:hypothetical protein
MIASAIDGKARVRTEPVCTQALPPAEHPYDSTICASCRPNIQTFRHEDNCSTQYFSAGGAAQPVRHKFAQSVSCQPITRSVPAKQNLYRTSNGTGSSRHRLRYARRKPVEKSDDTSRSGWLVVHEARWRTLFRAVEASIATRRQGQIHFPKS